MYFELALFAYLIDMLFGEYPGKHPVMYMGDFITGFERRFYSDRIISGAALVISLLLITFTISIGLVYLCQKLPDGLATLALAAIAATGLAMNMLYSSVADILNAPDPKQAISYLVSRDTEAMQEEDILKAALETWVENLSDGVIAPLFYLVLFGLPGIAVYKAINTLDSMIAYKTERYFYFGKTAAILDDIANFVPARITAVLIVGLASNRRRTWQCLLRDGNKLESLNAGYPIAALAGLLGVSLGGNAFYHGRLKQKPTLGLAVNPITHSTVIQALSLRPKIDLIIIGALAGCLVFWLLSART